VHCYFISKKRKRVELGSESSLADKDGDGYIELFNVNPNEANSGGGDDAPIDLTNTDVLQETHYYPFGMTMEGEWQNIVNGPENKYLYNGKELNSDFGLDWIDYGARYYDAAIGRWGQVDPLAEMYYSTSGYAYVLNNPIGLIDPNGMFAAPPTDFYNLKGNKVKHIADDKDDKKLVLTFSRRSKKVNQAIANGLVIRVHTNEEIAAMENAYEQTEASATKDKRYEKGFVGGTDANGNVVISELDEGMTKPNGTVLVDGASGEKKQLQAGASIEYTAHTHPYHVDDSGKTTLSSGFAQPSGNVKENEGDLGYQNKVEGKYGTKYSMILGYRNNGGTPRINFFNSSNMNISIDLSKYKKAIKKINK
jgi:RHS repeat-associated protein